MRPVVAILVQGGMGSAVGARLASEGLLVKTPLSGRSVSSVARAEAAGMTNASLEEIAQCDIILSIVPTAQALNIAEQLAPHLSASRNKPVYVDCNAVSPSTPHKIAGALEKTGCVFVDAAIIGLPPKPEGASPKFFACGPGFQAFDALSKFGLDVRFVDGPIGTASTLKMCYGGITKGVIAVGAAMVLAASRSGVAAALLAELSARQAALTASYRKSIPDMLPKAGRWIAEMEEISAFVGVDSAESKVYAGLAEFYRSLASGDDEAQEQCR